MRPVSPLRYPGGKAALAGLLTDIRRMNGLGDRPFAEPFGGGAGAALSLLFLERTPRIRINDADPAIHAFWWSVTKRTSQFNALLRQTPITIEEWLRQRATYRMGQRAGRLRLGFATFYLNRCNRSGIIMDGGPIGGIEQNGKWKLDARYNRAGLEDRIQRIVEFGSRIEIANQDGIEFIRSIAGNQNFLFIDPPYFEKGETLYLNAIDAGYHGRLADELHGIRDASWILTYDDCPEIRAMYEGWAQVRPFSLRYVAATRRRGRELLIAPKGMDLPTNQTSSAAIDW